MSDDGILNAQVDFSLQLLRELNLNQGVSTVFSPISIILALSLAYAGAEKETREEFDSVFAKGKDKEELHKYFQELTEFLNAGPDKPYTLETANQIYFDSNFTIKDTYKEVITQFYNGSFESLDFKLPANVAKKVNEFVKLKTHDKIKDLISADGISSDTKMILVNAIYYKGSWKHKFDKNLTTDKDFHVNENSTKQVKMMKKSDFKVIYSEGQDFQLIALPYEGSEIFFYAILPTEKFGLDNLLKNLDGAKLKKLLGKRHKTEVDVELPTFKIETSETLNSQLIKLGFKQGFTNGANFDGINEEERLKIDEVVHKAFIETNEEGSEAAAATGVQMRLLSAQMVPEEKPVFVADHPFLFALTTKASQVLFIGTVRDFE